MTAKYPKYYLKCTRVFSTFEMALNEHFPTQGKILYMIAVFGIFTKDFLKNVIWKIKTRTY